MDAETLVLATFILVIVLLLMLNSLKTSLRQLEKELVELALFVRRNLPSSPAKPEKEKEATVVEKETLRESAPEASDSIEQTDWETAAPARQGYREVSQAKEALRSLRDQVKGGPEEASGTAGEAAQAAPLEEDAQDSAHAEALVQTREDEVPVFAHDGLPLEDAEPERPEAGIFQDSAAMREQAAPWEQSRDGQEPEDTGPTVSRRLAALWDSAAASSGASSSASPVEGLVRTVINFIRAGNIWVAGGVLMVLLGFGLLVSFMADHGMLSVEMSIAFAALCGIAMVGFGHYLRLRKPVYAMVMQGGGIGVLYLAAFAAAKLTTLLTPGMALAFMTLLMVPAVGLALIQNAQVLAIFAFLGGYAAPILLSTGSGEYVLLFSYYTLLDLGLLAICRFRLWRWLNLLGATCSFGVMGAWGLFSYDASMFATVEPFLLGFTCIFLLITLLSVHKKEFSLANPPDISLALGVPLAATAFQWGVASEIPHGLSISSLAFGAFFLLLAYGLWKRWRAEAGRLAEVYAAAGALLVNLAVPLEFSGAVSSGVWAAEGALTFFFGCRYRSWNVRIAGLGLQGAGMAAFLYSLVAESAPEAHILVEAGLLALSALASAYWLRRETATGEGTDTALRPHWLEKLLAHPDNSIPLEAALTLLGMFWWFLGLAGECWRFSNEPSQMFFIAASLSGAAFCLAGRYLYFPALCRAVAVPLVFSVLQAILPLLRFPDTTGMMLAEAPFWQYLFIYQYFSGIEGVAWLVFASSLAVFFKFKGEGVPAFLLKWLPCALALEGVLILTCSCRALVSGFGLAPSWLSLAGLLPSMGYIFAVLFVLQKRGLPAAPFRALFDLVPAVLFCFLGGWVLLGFFDPGYPAPLPLYLPLLNPLELQQALCIALFLLWQHQLCGKVRSFFCLSGQRLLPATSLLAFAWLHSVIIRTTHFYAQVPFGESVWNENLFQVLLTGLWGLCGMGAIILGHKKKLRLLWIGGAGLIALDTAKLFLKDLADKDTLYHIVSFFIVGGIFLLIGLLAPLPPSLKNKDKNDGVGGGPEPLSPDADQAADVLPESESGEHAPKG